MNRILSHHPKHSSAKLIIFTCFALIFAGCTRQKEKFSLHTPPVKLTDYLYEITYQCYDPISAEKYVKTMENVSHGGACTVARNGDIIGRNYDYLYSEMAEFVIRVSATENRYASIGVASSVFELTAEKAETDPDGVYFDILPYGTVDGMNEKGLYCSVNMVISENNFATTGTNPNADESLYYSMAVRYVLDNCATAEEACKSLMNKNIIFSKALGEFHFLIADRNDTYIVEFFDNKLVYSHPKDNVITNFYVLTDQFINNDNPGLEPCGIERYEYAKEHIADFSSKDGASRVLENLKYSKIYDLTVSPFWYSDYYGEKCNGKVIDINTPKESYADHIKSQCENFKNKTRDYLEDVWITTHTSIYDLSDLTLRVYSQENYDKPIEISLK